VQNFSQLTAPLTELTKRECPWKAGPLPEPADKAYRELKTILISEPLIHHPDDKLPYALITDACQGDAVKPGGYGAILAQVRPEGQFQVIGYASRQLKDQEKHLAPFLFEMSASVRGMEQFTQFLRGRHFALYTDHKPLVNLEAVHTKTLSQIQEAMLKYNFEIIYLKGSEMPADFLSRNVVIQLSQNRIHSLQFENQDFELEQEKEPCIKEIKDWMMTGSECKMQTAISYMKNYWNNRFFIEDNLLWVRTKIKGEPARVCLVLTSHKTTDNFGKQSWNPVYWPRRSGQNKSHTTTKLLVVEYGFDDFRLHQDL
jgi:hypothetical protein